MVFRRIRRLGGAVAAGVSLLALVSCERPSWTVPENSKAPWEPPPLTAGAHKSVPRTAAGLPTLPAWAAPVLGKPVRQAFPRSGVCRGNTDNLTLIFDGRPPGVEIGGWGWDEAARARVDRVVLADERGLIVGAGEGGRRRKDVPRVMKDIQAMDTGWRASTPKVAGAVDAFGITDAGELCALGRADY